jgi:FSR family fosmidomycin resistance protein-like MFS transporter
MSTLAAPTPSLRADTFTISTVSVAHGLSHFCQLLIPPLFPWLAADFSLSNTELGLLMTVFFVVSCGGQALAGFVVDRYGARRVLFGGVACLALASLGLAASQNYATLLACMALAGIGNCVFHPVDFSILNARVSTHRLGHAYAAHGISGNIGWALAPIFVVGITQLSSWRVALVASALVIAAVLLLLVVFRDSLLVKLHAPAAQSGASNAAGSLDFLRLPAVWYCFAFFFTFAVALGGIQSFAPAAAGHLHEVPAAQIAICLSAYMFAAAAGMVYGGHLLRDPQRSARVVAFGFGSAALVALLIAFGDWSSTMVPVLFALMGLGAGIAGPSRDLLVKQATPEGATGRVYGVVYSGLDVGMSLAPALFGALMDAGQYRGVWIGVALALALLIVNAFNVKRRWRNPALAAA